MSKTLTEMHNEIRAFIGHIRRHRRYIAQLEADLHGVPEIEDPRTPDGPGETVDVMDWVVGEIIEHLRNDWESHVEEPPHKSARWIDLAIRTAFGSRWRWLDEYIKNGQSAWCGHALAPAEREAGLAVDVVEHRLQSCYRLRKFAQEFGLFVPVESMRRGDIVLIDTMGTPEKADHIPRCIWTEAGGDYPLYWRTTYDVISARHKRKYVDPHLAKPHYIAFEGNARGFGPFGDRYEGLVINARPVAKVRNVIRIDRRFYSV